jgi:hypothetical protein
MSAVVGIYHTALWNGSHCSGGGHVSCRLECPSDQVNGVFERSEASALSRLQGAAASCFYVARGQEGSGKRRPSSDNLCELGNMVSPPQACERNNELEGSDSAFVPRAFFRTTVMPTCVIHSQPTFAPPSPPEYRLTGLETLQKREKLQLCICTRCRKSNHRETTGAGDSEKQTSLTVLGHSMVEICDAVGILINSWSRGVNRTVL